MAALAGGPLNEPDEALAFLAGYGWSMWAVQRFEYYLAGFSIVRSPIKSPTRVLDTNQKAYSALRGQFATYRHRFERASAKELQNLLPQDVPEALRAELDELVVARNDLAHRYLRRTLDGTGRPDLREALQALRELGQRFVDAGDKLLALMEQSVAERPPNLSDVQFAALQRLGRAAAEGVTLEDALADGPA